MAFAAALLILLRRAKKEKLLYIGQWLKRRKYQILTFQRNSKNLFCLPANALLFEVLNHLDTIFQEAKPLMLWSCTPATNFITKEEWRKTKSEFDTVDKINYRKSIYQQLLLQKELIGKSLPTFFA
jgi:hypothetical protein